MACIEHSIAINAPPEATFGFVLADWQGHLRFWQHGVRNWQPLTSGPVGVGFRVRYTAQVLGVPFPMEMEVVAFEPGHGWTARSVSGPPAEGRWAFAAHPAGTLFTYGLTYRMPPPLLGPLLDRWFFAPAWRRSIAGALANLKRLVEAQQHARRSDGAA